VRLGARAVQGLECLGPSLFEGTPKHFETKIFRRKSIFWHGEIDRHETRRPAGQCVEQSALMGKRLPQRVWRHSMRLVL
jgi:hypothetical protein